jgi:hypothetical protein
MGGVKRLNSVGRKNPQLHSTYQGFLRMKSLTRVFTAFLLPEFDVRKSARKQVGRELETFSQRNFILNN